ncbi:unnamed protein product, partial [Prorocentrum cordatum]
AGKLKIDQRLIQDPGAMKRFQDALLEMPLEPWCSEVNAHCCMLTSGVLQAASEVFRPTIRLAKDPYVSQ